MKNKVGRPNITPVQKEEMLRKLEPYLKSGLSIRKTCFEAGVPRSTVYKLMEIDQGFMDQIKRFQQFISVIFANSMARELYWIVRKQNEGKELNKTDIKFLCWFAIHSNLTREEFGRRENFTLFDPETEIQRIRAIIDSASKQEETSSQNSTGL